MHVCAALWAVAHRIGDHAQAGTYGGLQGFMNDVEIALASRLLDPPTRRGVSLVHMYPCTQARLLERLHTSDSFLQARVAPIPWRCRSAVGCPSRLLCCPFAALAFEQTVLSSDGRQRVIVVVDFCKLGHWRKLIFSAPERTICTAVAHSNSTRTHAPSFAHLVSCRVTSPLYTTADYFNSLGGTAEGTHHAVWAWLSDALCRHGLGSARWRFETMMSRAVQVCGHTAALCLLPP